MKEPHIIDYILENTDAHSQQRLNQRNKSNWKKEFNLFYCKSCKRAYEYGRTTCTKSKKIVLKYDDFPIFGLERKVCMNCNTDIAVNGATDSLKSNKT